MELKNLLTAPYESLTDEELVAKIRLLQKARFKNPLGVGGKERARKTNLEKQIENLIKSGTPEQLQSLHKLFKK